MREAPTQYYETLSSLIGRLQPNTRDMRRQVYDRVRELLVLEAQQADPPWDLLEIVQEQRALEEAIKEVEADYEFEEARHRQSLPKAEEWQELERSLPSAMRRPEQRGYEPRPPEPRRDNRLPVPARRVHQQDDFEPRDPRRSTALTRFGLPRWKLKLPDRRQLVLVASGLGILLLLYLSIAAIAGYYPFSRAAPPPEQAKQETPPAPRVTPAEWAERGNEASKNGEYDTAIEAYGNAVRGGQRTAGIYNNRAFAFWVKGETNRAIADYDEALRIEPDNIVALANRAIAYNFRGDYDLAIKDLDRALKLEPNNADVWNSRCWGRALAEQLKEALADCAEALRIRPNDANTYDSRGFTYLKMGQFDRAISDYDQALKINPRLAGALYGRGIAKTRKGDRGGSTDIAAAKAMRPEIEAVFSRYGIR